MELVKVKLSDVKGKIKPMHAVNNGPKYTLGSDQKNTNLGLFVDAGIPYGRTHDSSAYVGYGGSHTVDITAVFPNFDADPYDPASYDFVLTDEYMQVMKHAGVEPFYRLGQRIEHEKKKYGIIPPKDFKKWAVICEHIIKHLNYGWADGYEMGIKYWEIWNEPDLDTDDAKDKHTWGGTKAEFFELYHIAATHLKEKFPELKIGGPALAFRTDWAEDFLAQLNAPLDFFSWHRYRGTVAKVTDRMDEIRALLDKYGYTQTESILNEWNYVKSWSEEDTMYSIKVRQGMKGAAFTAAVMCEGQKHPVDMLMYYDARPFTSYNGLCGPFVLCEPLKGYYPFKVFGELYRLGTEVYSESQNDIYSCAALDGDRAAIMLTRFSDEEDIKQVKVELSEAFEAIAEIYLVDEDHEFELIRKENVNGGQLDTYLDFAPNSIYLIKLKPKESI